MALTAEEEAELLRLLELDAEHKELDGKFRPQPGPQEMFLNTTADIALYGGAAGGGKTYALLLENLRHVDNPRFGSVIFRRNSNQIMTEGGLWDSALELYPLKGGTPKITPRPVFVFASGAKVSFAHLQYEADIHGWQGAQIPLICCEASTLIRMADGSKKRLSDIQTGDMVQTLNGPKSVTVVGAPRLAECVECADEYGNKQIQSTTHKLLTKHGWISYDDIACEPRRHRGRALPIARRSARRFALSFDKIRQSLQRCPVHFLSHQPHVSRSSRLPQDHQSSLETFACTAQPSLGTDFELSLCGNSVAVRRISNRRWLTLLSRSLGLKAYISRFFPFRGASANVLSAKERRGWLDRCLTYFRRGDERVGVVANSSRVVSLRLDGVVQHIQKDSLLDDRGKVQRRIHRRLRYVHPYTFQEQIAEEDVSFSSITLTPCGKRIVIDLTIADTNHYITEFGLVNKNCFDELTHFTRKQFFYMLSRNRSTCGVKPYIRATTNPEAETWVADFIDWWIDDQGDPIQDRSGIIRYFLVVNDEVKWADSREELVAQYGGRVEDTKSFTFIPSSIYDNKILLEHDPGYLANLNALSSVEKGRLLHGNWKVKPSAGMYFRRDQAEVVPRPPSEIIRACRAWDLAATVPTPENPSPDATAGVLIGAMDDGRFIVLDVIRVQQRSNDVRELIRATAEMDKEKYSFAHIRLPQDPGQAGKEQAESYVKHLAGFAIKTQRVSGDKITRAEPFSAQWQAGNVLILAGAWNEAYFAELESFPDGKHDDLVDASSDAFADVTQGAPVIARILTTSYDDLFSAGYGHLLS